MSKLNTLDICRKYFMSDVSEMVADGVQDVFINRILRLRDAYNIWNNQPTLRRRQIVDYLIQDKAVSESTAYEDIQVIETLLGDINESSKKFYRWQFNQTIYEAMELARKKGDIKALTKAAEVFAKYNKLDQEDINEITWKDVQNPFLNIVIDPTPLGFKKIPNLMKVIPEMERELLDFIDPEEMEKEKEVTDGKQR